MTTYLNLRLSVGIYYPTRIISLSFLSCSLDSSFKNWSIKVFSVTDMGFSKTEHRRHYQGLIRCLCETHSKQWLTSEWEPETLGIPTAKLIKPWTIWRCNWVVGFFSPLFVCPILRKMIYTDKWTADSFEKWDCEIAWKRSSLLPWLRFSDATSPVHICYVAVMQIICWPLHMEILESLMTF